MDGLRGKFSLETLRNSMRSDEMLKTRKTNRKPVSCYNSGKEGQISLDYISERQDSRQRDERQNQGGRQMAERVKFRTDVKEATQKKASETVLSVKGYNNGCL